MDFGCFYRLSANYTHLTYRYVVCLYSVMAETIVKHRAFAFIVLDSQYGKTRLSLHRRYFSAVQVITTSQTACGIPPDCGPPEGEVGTVLFRLFPRLLCHMHGVYSGGNRGGNQRMALHKRAKFVIAPTDWGMRATLFSNIQREHSCCCYRCLAAQSICV